MKISKWLTYAGILALLAITVACAVFAYTLFSHKGGTQNLPSFAVSGEGKESITPDIAQFTFTIITEKDEEISKIYQENSDTVTKVKKFLADNGIEDKDIQSTFYNLNPRYQYYTCTNGPCPAPEISGYSLNNGFLVKVRDLNKLNDLLSGVVKNGSNSVYGLAFTVDDPSELKNKAREKAFADAKKKAEDLAKSGGFSLGRLLSVEESLIGGGVNPYYGGVAMGMGGGGYGGPGIEAGSQEIIVQLVLRYEIK